MSDRSRIEWCDTTWNVVTGCSKVSQGCKNCYAETIAKRFWSTQYPPNEDGTPRKFTDVRVHPERLEEPLKWRKPRRVFVNSMSDLFHESVPDEFIDQVGRTISRCKTPHTFMILTKRPERMMKYFIDRGNWTNNVWLGVSVEDQRTADERIPLLLQTPAAVRFVSYEPALEGVDFTPYLYGWHSDPRPVELDPGIDWIIMGGESGPGARPMHPDWARSVRDQCQVAGVPFFFKQWGEYVPNEQGCGSEGYDFKNRHIAVRPDGTHSNFRRSDDNSASMMAHAGKKAAGRLLDGREWDEYPEAK